MKSFSQFILEQDNVDEGIGLSIARAIDKTVPAPGGRRGAKRRGVSHALKMREVLKGAKKRKDDDKKSPVSFLQDKD